MEPVMEAWIKSTRQRFPHLHDKTYIVPPVHFPRVLYGETPIGSDIKVPRPDIRMSDVRADEAMGRVHNVLSSVFEGKTDEVMFICFSMYFDNYLNYGGKRNMSPDDQLFSLAGSRGRANGERTSAKRSPKTWPSGSSARHVQINGRNRHEVTSSADPHRRTPMPSPTDLPTFRRPRDLPPHLRRGEFDILFIHRDVGFVVGEVKAVGDMFGVMSGSLGPSLSWEAICRRLHQSVRQLDKQVEVLRYLLEDVSEHIPVTKVLVLPNLREGAVRAALASDPELEQAFCRTFDATTLDAALQNCVFSEKLPPIGHLAHADDDVIRELYTEWWLPLRSKIPNWGMNGSLYESIIARFCGPATKQYVVTACSPRAEVSTLAQAVLETARCFSEPVLTEEQVVMLRDPSPKVFLSGPPGTGKTLMLMLKAKEWLREGHPVMIISLWPSSHAVSCRMYSQIKDEVTTERLLHVLNETRSFDEVINALLNFRYGCQMRPSHSPYLEAPAQENQSLDSGFVDCLLQYFNDEHKGDDQKDDQSGPDPGRDEPRADGMMTDSVSQSAGSSRKRPVTQEPPTDVPRHQRRNQSPDQHDSRCKKPRESDGKLHVVVPEAPCLVDQLVQVLEAVLGKEGFIIWAATSLPCRSPSRFASFPLTRNLRRPPAVVRAMTKTPAYDAFTRVKYTSQDAGVLSGTPFPTDGPAVKRIHHEGHKAATVEECEECAEALASFLTQDLKIGNGAVSENGATSTAREKALRWSDVLVSGRLSSMNERGVWPRFLDGLKRNDIYVDVLKKDDVGSYQKLAVPCSTKGVQVAGHDMIKGLERPVVVVLEGFELSDAVPQFVDPLYDVMGCCTSQLVIVGDVERCLTQRLKGLLVTSNCGQK